MSRSREYPRAARMVEAVRREVSDILRREVKDPRVHDVTLTRIKVADDLKNATVWFGVMSHTAEAAEVEEALNRSAGYIHHLMVKRMDVKVVPRLIFRFDKNLDYSFEISKILHQIEEETPSPDPAPAEGETAVPGGQDEEPDQEKEGDA